MWRRENVSRREGERKKIARESERGLLSLSRGGYCSKPPLGGSRILLSRRNLPYLFLPPPPPPLFAPLYRSLAPRSLRNPRLGLKRSYTAEAIFLKAPHLKEHGLRLWPLIRFYVSQSRNSQGQGKEDSFWDSKCDKQ